MARASGRDGTESVVPIGVLMERPSSVTPYHCVDSDSELDDVGDKYAFMNVLVGLSRDMFVAELVPSTPAEMGLSTVDDSSSKSFQGGAIGLMSTVL